MVFQIDDSNYPYPLKTGIQFQPQSTKQISSALGQMFEIGSDFLITPFYSDDNITSPLDLDRSFIYSDRVIHRNDTRHLIMYINESILKQKSQFLFMIGYASYLGIYGVSIEIRNDNILALTQLFKEARNQISKAQIAIIFNVCILKQSIDNQQMWIKYVQFRSKISDMLKVQLNLQITENLPTQQHIIGRWVSQKVHYLTMKTQCFLTNQKGYPVLTPMHQRLVLKLLKLRSHFVIKCEKVDEKIAQYIKYICFLYKNMVKKMQIKQKHAYNLLDYLQNPLQPYSDNLQCQTYKIFQSDSPKYDQYEIAIGLALQKLNVNRQIIIYYIGTGRGGLIPKVFAQSKKYKKKIKLYAIQKNPYPIQSVKQMIKQNKWSNYVTIVHADIKSYEMPEKPDIFLSQLLGGFGDNELSPQCLLWAQKNITKQTLCIPQKYTSFMRPTSYRSIHRSLSQQRRQGYYTILFGNYYTPFKEQKVWEFEHPLKSKQQLNKTGICSFSTPFTIQVDGFIGYFTTVLHDTSYLSICPTDHTFASYSWFPIYFPFFQAELLHKNQTITIQIQRFSTPNQVWYEWKYSIFDQNKKQRKNSKIHNYQGRQISIQL